MSSAVESFALADVGRVFDMLFGQSSLGISLHDHELRVVYVNAFLAALGGRPAAEYLGRPLGETFPAVAAAAEPHIRQVLSTGHAKVGVEFVRPDRHLVASYYPVLRPDGAILGVGVVVYDDTDHHESEQRYGALVELSPDGTVIMEDEVLTYVNPSAAEILGASDPRDLIGRSAWDLLVAPPDGARPGGLTALVAARAGRAYDVTVRRPDGSNVTLSVRSVPVDRGHVPSVQSVFRDVSRRRREQREREDLIATLARERGLFSAVLRELPVGVAVIDPDGKVVLRNDAADWMWGVRSALPDGKDDGGVRPSHEETFLRALRNGATSADLAIDVDGDDGHVRNLRGSVAPIHAADGTTRGVVATFWDVTALTRAQEALRRTSDALETRVIERTASLADANERLRHEASEREAAERQLRVAERLASIGTLAAGVAHEINNPLAAIVATAELARVFNTDGARHAELDEALARIVDEAHRAGDIVKGLLHLGRGEHIECWPIDVSDVVRQVTSSPNVAAVMGTARLRTRLARVTPRVVMNPRELEQVVVNLLRNAVQAGAKEVLVQTAVADGHVRLVVRDDGQGIDPRDVERVFDPFFTTHVHDGGTGLGLSIVHGIVTRYDGRIDVQSRPGRGTTFTVELPWGIRRARVA